MKMITNIFRIFDPSTRSNLTLNWARMALIFILLPYNFWVKQSRFINLWSWLINIILKEFKILINFSYSNLVIFTSLFIFILSRNFIGLIPYIFTSSRHIRFSLSLSLSIWLGIILFRVINYFNDLSAHLTPQGTPIVLIPFIVIIESIRLIIRPFTLAIRLTANIIAGHLLLSLLGSSGLTAPLIFLPILAIPEILLLVLELAVSIIQAYVFSILSTLYSRDLNE